MVVRFVNMSVYNPELSVRYPGLDRLKESCQLFISLAHLCIGESQFLRNVSVINLLKVLFISSSLRGVNSSKRL